MAAPVRLRTLPLTIAVMALLLGVKSIDIVRAAVPEASPAKAAPEPAPKEGKPAATPPPAPSAAVEPPKSPAEPLVSDAERALLLDLRQRRKELEAREAATALRETIIAAAEKRLGARADELATLQKKLEALEKARQDRDTANWAGLVKVYEGMKPKDAAAIFNDLDLAVLLPVLDRMKEGKAATVLAAMQPDRARLVTVQLAQTRNKANAAPGAPPATAKNGT